MLDPRRDLLPVADLIETCFATTMDPDGREYLRQMRQAAQEEMLLPWNTGLGMSGYVWEEDGVVVGNLTLIPMFKQNRRVYLIANVAVLPKFRRRGIARELTEAALLHAKRNGAMSAWLQVRSENLPATQLYRSMGFTERSQRTNWVYDANSKSETREPGVTINPRRPTDWKWQSAWLEMVYPPDITWNISLNINRLRPGMMNLVYRFLMSERIEHLAARDRQGPLGMVTWEPSHAYADTLWLATLPESEERAIRALLPAARRMIPSRRPLVLNYPANRAEAAFQTAGMHPQQTLLWMEKPFLAQPDRS
jgi:ribosomal protein S18 acetylase RimI-like enzyme